METMFFGALALTQAALPVMRRQGSGAVVQISSIGGQVTVPGVGAYCAAKFALEAVSESLAAEIKPFGIRVLIVEPGAFATGFGGARMQRSPQLGDVYAETVGPTRVTEWTDRNQATRPRRRRRSSARSATATRRCIWRSAATRSTRSVPLRTAAAPTLRHGSR
jgi:NAD(P)-dependent dehydrogenase (short-subunit alcohol dehydrogenase family)